MREVLTLVRASKSIQVVECCIRINTSQGSILLLLHSYWHGPKSGLLHSGPTGQFPRVAPRHRLAPHRQARPRPELQPPRPTPSRPLPPGPACQLLAPPPRQPSARPKRAHRGGLHHDSASALPRPLFPLSNALTQPCALISHPRAHARSRISHARAAIAELGPHRCMPSSEPCRRPRPPPRGSPSRGARDAPLLSLSLSLSLSL